MRSSRLFQLHGSQLTPNTCTDILCVCPAVTCPGGVSPFSFFSFDIVVSLAGGNWSWHHQGPSAKLNQSLWLSLAVTSIPPLSCTCTANWQRIQFLHEHHLHFFLAELVFQLAGKLAPPSLPAIHHPSFLLFPEHMRIPKPFPLNDTDTFLFWNPPLWN